MELQAKDLRIGNWIADYEHKNPYFQVEAIQRHNDKLKVVYRNGSSWATEPEPITLTEEWLLRFGFKKSKVSSQFDKGKLTIQIANELEYHKNGRVYFNSWAILYESIRYVHQLQNLYHALTGEELEIKEVK
jgi:hypothetical protein